MPETTKWNDPRISRVIALELKVTRAIINGHRPAQNDEYENDRLELERLRKELGYLKNKIQNTNK